MARRRLGGDAFLKAIVLRDDDEARGDEASGDGPEQPRRRRDPAAYPFSIPAVRALKDPLELHPKVTFFVGENGSGKSTILEALAVAAGFNPEGGTKNFNFQTRASHSSLHDELIVAWGQRPKDGFFFRGESFYTVATELDALAAGDPAFLERNYGGRSLHERSHGEAFLALVNNRFGGHGLFLMDEPESALSPARLLSLLAAIHGLTRRGSQLVIATHSPVLLAYPEATIYAFDGPDGFRETAWEETEHVRLTREFLNAPGRYLKHLLQAVEDNEAAERQAAPSDDARPTPRRRKRRT